MCSLADRFSFKGNLFFHFSRGPLLPFVLGVILGVSLSVSISVRIHASCFMDLFTSCVMRLRGKTKGDIPYVSQRAVPVRSEIGDVRHGCEDTCSV
jgi:hypothetical protein